MRVVTTKSNNIYNHYQAAIASVFEFDLKDVPVFRTCEYENVEVFYNEWLKFYHPACWIFKVSQNDFNDSEVFIVSDGSGHLEVFDNGNFIYASDGGAYRIKKPVSVFKVKGMKPLSRARDKMNRYIQVEMFCRIVRDSFEGAEYVYTHGSCYKFHEILAQKFKDAEPYYNVDHVISKIGNRFYDITGEVDGTGFTPLKVETNSLEFYQGSNKFRLFEQPHIENMIQNIFGGKEVKRQFERLIKRLQQVRENLK